MSCTRIKRVSVYEIVSSKVTWLRIRTKHE